MLDDESWVVHCRKSVVDEKVHKAIGVVAEDRKRQLVKNRQRLTRKSAKVVKRTVFKRRRRSHVCEKGTNWTSHVKTDCVVLAL